VVASGVPIDLATLVEPAHTVLITQECQEGVLGPSSSLPALADAASAMGLVDRVQRLATVARASGVRVVHCVIQRRPDNLGSNRNARLFAAAERSGSRMVMGSPLAAVVAGIDVLPEDLVCTRSQGLSPMTGTELDPVLRNIGCRTIVVTGVSVNIAVTNLAFDAVNRGYQVVIVRDAVTGVPPDYAQAVLENTLSLVATLTTADELAAVWEEGSRTAATDGPSS
jgi:nicotinamidase-related amidase